MHTWVIAGDFQIPFHDKPVVQVFVDVVRELKPHGVILNGDVIDCYTISEFSKDPLSTADLAKEQKLVSGLMAQVAPHTKERWWLGGNHEDRVRRYIWNHAPKFAPLDELTFPALFHLGDHGFRWKEYGGAVMLGKLMVTHGNSVSKHSGQTARAHMEKYGTSILVNHTHRLGAFFKRDVRGVHGAWENGCLCGLNPEYDQHPNWQQGFSIVQVDPVTGFFNVQQLPVLNRKTVFYGTTRYGGVK